MTDEEQTPTWMSAAGWDAHSVIAVSFDDDDNAVAALTRLKELDAQFQLSVDEAVVVARDPDGRVVETDRIEPLAMPASVGVGLTGLLVGIIGGPLGMLVGGMSGLMVGSLIDMHDADKTVSDLDAISSVTRLGRTALLAVVSEQSPEVIDTAMAGLGGTVLRRPVLDVEAEIAAAETTQRKAKLAARRELLQAHRERNKEAVHTKVSDLKTKLRPDQQAPSAST